MGRNKAKGLWLFSFVMAMVGFLAFTLGMVKSASADTKPKVAFAQEFELTGDKNGKQQTILSYDASDGQPMGHFRFDPDSYENLQLIYKLKNVGTDAQSVRALVTLPTNKTADLPQYQFLQFDTSGNRRAKLSGDSPDGWTLSYRRPSGNYSSKFDPSDVSGNATITNIQFSGKADDDQYNGAPTKVLEPNQSITLSVPLKVSNDWKTNGNPFEIRDLWEARSQLYGSMGEKVSAEVYLHGAKAVQLSPTFTPVTNNNKLIDDKTLKAYLPQNTKDVKGASDLLNLQKKNYDSEFVTGSLISIDPKIFVNVQNDGYYLPKGESGTDGQIVYKMNKLGSLDTVLQYTDWNNNYIAVFSGLDGIDPKNWVEPVYIPLTQAISAKDFTVDKTADLNGKDNLNGLTGLFDENSTAIDNPKNNAGLKVSVKATSDPQTANVTYTFNGVSKTVTATIKNPTPVTPNGDGSSTNTGSTTTTVPSTPVTPSNPSNPSAGNSSSSATSSSSQSQSTQSVPDYATVKGTAVYAVKGIYMYKHADFRKSQRIAKYPKAKRTNRPMFVVTNYARSKGGALRYKVRDVKTHKVGYITANTKFVVRVYYQTVPKNKKITVISKKGVNAYKKANLTKKTKHYKKGTRLTVKKLVKHNLTTRYQLTNGRYVTANKKLVIQGNY